MELRQLQYFVAVAEELHYGHASERMHLTQAALSQQIGRLERELGVRLLERTTRRVRLTAAGRLFLEDARVTLARAERAAETARLAAKGEVGRLFVGYPVTGRGRQASAILRTFRERYPGVTLNALPRAPADLLEQLRHEHIDLAFIHHLIDDDHQLASRVIGRAAYVLALPAGHRLAVESDVAVDEMAIEPLLLFPRQLSPHHHDHLMKDLTDRCGSRPHIVEEASAVGDLIEAVEAGVGVALIIEREAPRPPSNNVVLRQFRTPAPTRPLAIAWRRNDRSPTLAAFLKVVEESHAASRALS